MPKHTRFVFTMSAPLQKTKMLTTMGVWIALAFLIAPFLNGCSTMVQEEPKAEVVQEDGRTFIVDSTNKRWDVTHAVKNYGFVAAEFQFGIGPNAIRPINNPLIVPPGAAGYPSSSSSFLVIGTTLEKESRAYRISDLTPHEIVNERFKDTHVAVGW